MRVKLEADFTHHGVQYRLCVDFPELLAIAEQRTFASPWTYFSG
jgi:hypothetical protein